MHALRTFLIITVAAAAVGLAWRHLTGESTFRKAAQILPDRSQVMVEAITFGKEHQLSRWRPWEARLINLVPDRFKTMFNLQNNSTFVVSSAFDLSVIWMTQRDPTGKYLSFDVDHAEIVDEHGVALRARGGPKTETQI